VLEAEPGNFSVPGITFIEPNVNGNDNLVQIETVTAKGYTRLIGRLLLLGPHHTCNTSCQLDRRILELNVTNNADLALLADSIEKISGIEVSETGNIAKVYLEFDPQRSLLDNATIECTVRGILSKCPHATSCESRVSKIGYMSGKLNKKPARIRVLNLDTTKQPQA
jgi:hypothetical protein